MTHELMTLTKLKDDSIVIGVGIGLGLGMGLGVGLGVGLGAGLIVEFESVRDGLIIALTLSHWVMSHESCYSDTPTKHGDRQSEINRHQN